MIISPWDTAPRYERFDPHAVRRARELTRRLIELMMKGGERTLGERVNSSDKPVNLRRGAPECEHVRRIS